MVRLVFRPYTRVWRTICTSVSLRASTRVSSDFALLRHSSPSFGSQQACSYSNLSQKIMVGRCCTPRGRITPSSSYLRLAWVCRPPARMHVRLLGPCFKTGRMKSPLRRRPERAGAPEGARPPPEGGGRALPPKKGILGLPDGIGRPRRPTFIPPGKPTPTSAPRRAADQLTQPFRIRPGRTRGLHSLPSQQFQALFNSLFKVLFIFPSRYLFAIGLPPVFSLGRNLPPS